MSSKQYKIYVIQMHTKTIPSRIIKVMTRYKYSHMAISFNKKCNKLYSFGRKKYNSIFDGGFVCENKNGEFFKKFKDTNCRIYEVNVTKEQYYNLKRIIKDMELHQESLKYDYLGICLRYFRIPISFKNKYVCSYFVAEMLEEVDIHKFNKKTYFVEPKDFENINEFNLIYSGNYLMYR